MIPVVSLFRPPGIYGSPSRVLAGTRGPVPEGPHDWLVEGMTRACKKCCLIVSLETNGERDLPRIAGTLCTDAPAMEVMNS